MTDSIDGLTGIAALEAEMADRLSAKNAEIESSYNQAVEEAARIAETLVFEKNVAPSGHITRIHRGATGQEIADEIRRQLLRKA